MLAQRTDEVFSVLEDINGSLVIGSMEDVKNLSAKMQQFSELIDSASPELLAKTSSVPTPQPEMVRTIPIDALELRGRMYVNPAVDAALDGVEQELARADAGLEAAEAVYTGMAAAGYSENLSRIRARLMGYKDSCGESSTLEELRAVLEGIRAITGMNASAALENLSSAERRLSEVHAAAQGVSYVNSSRNPRASRMELEIAEVLNRTEADFWLVRDAWQEMRKSEDELSGIEDELRRMAREMGMKRSACADELAALAEESADVRRQLQAHEATAMDAGEVLQRLGVMWAEISRSLQGDAVVTEVPQEYLNETADARVTQEIASLAAALGYEPERIYDFVRENVSYEAYLGSARGSVWTLSSGAGNDFDQASLLIALLRASGIPARYVQGWVELSREKLVELVGGKNVTVNGTSYAMNFTQAVAVIDSVAIPYNITDEGVQMEHVWVEALMPAGRCRHRCFEMQGAWMNGSQRGCSSMHIDYTWQRMDPVLDEYTVLSAVNYAEIPEEYRHRVQISTSDGIVSEVMPLPLLAGERVVLRFVPASEEDVTLLGDESLYRLLDAGGKSWYVGYNMWGYWESGPTYAYVVPELLIGNETVARGNVTKLGSWQTLILNFSYADRWIQSSKGYLAGDMLSITLSPAYEPPQRVMEEAEEAALLYQRYNTTRNASAYDDFVAQMLYTTGIAYYAASDRTSELAGEVFFTESYSPTTRGDYVHRGARYWETWKGFWGFYDVYATYAPGGPAHDHRVSITQSYSRIGQREGMVAFNLLAEGFAGSGWESQSIYALYNTTAVSTTYILAYAQSKNITVYTINSTNINETLQKLRVDGWIKDEIREKVMQGYIVLIPESYVTINQWRGTGWAVIDPYTGLGAYIIAGGYYKNTTPPQILAGGWSTVPYNYSEVIAPGECAVNASRFECSAVNLSEGLQNVTDKIQADEKLTELLIEVISHGSAIVITTWAGITLILGGIAGEIGGVGLTTPAVIAAIGLGIFLLIPNIVLFLSIAQETKKILIDPAGEIIVLR